MRSDVFGLWAIEEIQLGAVHEALRTGKPLAAAGETEEPAVRYTDGGNGRAPSGGAGGMIAVVPVCGVMMKGDDGWGGIAPTAWIRGVMGELAANEAVSAILLLIDSGGGTVSGTADLAAAVKAAAAVKPVWAYCEDLCASAAYWVASSTEKVFANNATALIGSIGTLAMLADMSEWAGKAGIKVKVYQTGPLKAAGRAGTAITEEHDKYFQGIVDEIQTHFSAAVQENRGLTGAQLAAVTTGAVFPAAEAQRLGLIDGIQSFEQTILGLAQEASKKKSGAGQGARASDATHVQAEEVVMTTPQTQPGAAVPQSPAPTPVAATLPELKAALPKASADFLLGCLEKQQTIGQAQAAYIAHADARVDELQAKSKKVGVPALTEGKAKADEGGQDFDALVRAKLAANPNMTRRDAVKAMARENPEAHKAYVSASPPANLPEKATRKVA